MKVVCVLTNKYSPLHSTSSHSVVTFIIQHISNYSLLHHKFSFSDYKSNTNLKR